MKIFLCFLLAALLLFGCKPADPQVTITHPPADPTIPSQEPADTDPTPSKPKPTSPPDPPLELLDVMTLEDGSVNCFLPAVQTAMRCRILRAII